MVCHKVKKYVYVYTYTYMDVWNYYKETIAVSFIKECKVTEPSAFQSLAILEAPKDLAASFP